MERKVPSTASDEIDLYMRTIYSLLRTTTEVQIRTLEEVHAGMKSSLHPDARKSFPDTSAFIYSILRLPSCMPDVNSVILGQSPKMFSQHGYPDVESWEPVSARARRRRCFFNGKNILACYIASRSDIDDMVPIMVAYQIEWNKLHDYLKSIPTEMIVKAEQEEETFEQLADALEMSKKDLRRLKVIWDDQFQSMMQRIALSQCRIGVRLLNSSLSEYWRATHNWWDNIEHICPELRDRPVYFISSNNHSLTNLLSGFALHRQDELIKYIEQNEDKSLMQELEVIRTSQVPSSMENFFYYVLKKYQQSSQGKHLVDAQISFERENNIIRIPSAHSFDVEAQVIDLSHLSMENIDPRLKKEDWTILKQSDAYILNIDYPLGLSAYNILIIIAENTGSLEGIYIMGKAATLNGVYGDIMIPNVVHDEQSQNTYLFHNVFTAANVSPYLTYGTVLDNQKGVSVFGTFLQNKRVMDVIYREGYTDIEMEAGAYLSAVFEMVRPRRHPVNEIINIYDTSPEIGILHYASDTPLSKGKNLGAGALSYFGIDSTYAASLAILRRIFHKERERLGGR